MTASRTPVIDSKMLAGDVADNIQDGNPHADKLGNKDIWSFVRGPAKTPGKTPPMPVDNFVTTSANSILGQWRKAVADPASVVPPSTETPPKVAPAPAPGSMPPIVTTEAAASGAIAIIVGL